MAAPTPASRGGSGGGVVPAEWPAQAADTIVDTIAKVRDRTTKPLVTAARAAVYGLIALMGVAVLLVLLLVVTTRMWDNWVPGGVWIYYAVLCGLFTVIGLVLLRKANAPAPVADA